jgi:hypothetical protein
VSPTLCGAKPRPGGERKHPCQKPVTPGMNRCSMHGSKSPRAKAKKKRDELEAQVDKAIAKLDIVPVEDPLTELGKLAGRVLAWEKAIREHVDKLTNLRYSTENGEAIRGEIVLFERAMDRCAMVLGLIAKLNIDERLARITENQAEMLETALFAAFEEAGLTIADTGKRERVAAAFGRHLALVAPTG